MYGPDTNFALTDGRMDGQTDSYIPHPLQTSYTGKKQ